MFVHNPCDGGLNDIPKALKKVLEDSVFLFAFFFKDCLPDLLVFNQSSSFN